MESRIHNKRRHIRRNFLLKSFTFGLTAGSIAPLLFVQTTNISEKVNINDTIRQESLQKASTVTDAANIAGNQTDINQSTSEAFSSNETLNASLPQGNTGTLKANDVSFFGGGAADFTLSLGFLHSGSAGRGWNNMFWGNHYFFSANGINSELINVNPNYQSTFGDKTVINQPGMMNDNYISQPYYTMTDYPENRGVAANMVNYRKTAQVFNFGSTQSTLSGDNYALRLNYDGYDEGNIWSGDAHANFTLGANPKLQDDVSSGFLLLMYNMLIEGNGVALTGDKTWDSSPEWLFINPVYQIRRTSSINRFTDESLIAAIGSGVLGSIVGGLAGGPGGAIAGAVGPTLTNLFVPQLNGAGQAGIKTSLHNPEYIPIRGAKNFLWDTSVSLSNKYFSANSKFKVDKFFVNDINLGMNLQVKPLYTGWNASAWKPYIRTFDPSMSISYSVSGTRNIKEYTSYDFSNYFFENQIH